MLVFFNQIPWTTAASYDYPAPNALGYVPRTIAVVVCDYLGDGAEIGGDRVYYKTGRYSRRTHSIQRMASTSPHLTAAWPRLRRSSQGRTQGLLASMTSHASIVGPLAISTVYFASRVYFRVWSGCLQRPFM